MPEIPDEVANAEAIDGAIPQSVTEIPQEVEAPEANPYLISFAKYNDDVCEISELASNKARRAVESFKLIGTKIKSVADFQRHSVDRLPVSKAGDYRKLFRGLEDDIELKELKLQQDARIFYFDIEPERTLYVVAITNNHLETDKVRRR